jgi:excisionase family DNA binding protein
MLRETEHRPRLLRAEEVAAQLGVRTDFVYDLARRHLIPVIRVGRYCRFDPIALGRWIAEGGTPETEPDRGRTVARRRPRRARGGR